MPAVQQTLRKHLHQLAVQPAALLILRKHLHLHAVRLAVLPILRKLLHLLAARLAVRLTPRRSNIFSHPRNKAVGQAPTALLQNFLSEENCYETIFRLSVAYHGHLRPKV